MRERWRYLDLADFLVIAEAALGVSAEDLLRVTQLHLASPLPDGSKRVGYMCAVEFAERNGFEWEPPKGDDPGGDETVRVIEGVAAGTITEPGSQLGSGRDSRSGRSEL